MSDTAPEALIGGIPPLRLFRVSLHAPPDIAVMAHMMTHDNGALVFHEFRLADAIVAEMVGQAVAVQYCTRMFAPGQWSQAQEEQMPAVKSEKAH